MRNMERRREKSKTYSKNHREKHKEEIRKKKKIYSEKNKEKISSYMKKYYLENKDKMCISKKEYYKTHSKEARYKRIKRIYNISLNEYEKLFTEQNGVCAICSKPETAKEQNRTLKSLAVDHDHKTDKNRGLLCGRCNAAIGLLMDSIELLDKAKKYLLKYDIN